MGAILTLLEVLTPWVRVPPPIPAGATHDERKPATATTNERPQLEKEACGMALRGRRAEECKSTDKLGWYAYLEDARQSELYGAGL